MLLSVCSGLRCWGALLAGPAMLQSCGGRVAELRQRFALPASVCSAPAVSHLLLQRRLCSVSRSVIFFFRSLFHELCRTPEMGTSGTRLRHGQGCTFSVPPSGEKCVTQCNEKKIREKAHIQNVLGKIWGAIEV